MMTDVMVPSVKVNALLVIAGAIVAGLIAATVTRETSPARLPGRKTAGKRTKGNLSKEKLVSFTYVQVPRYTRKDNQLVPLVIKGVPITRNLVKETPSELLAMAVKKLGRPIVLDDFILATVIASEAGPSFIPYVRGAIGNTVINHQNAIGQGIFEVLQNGMFADQMTGSYVSTARPPTEEDLLIAEAVRDGRLKDVTGGAVQFDSPRAQRALLAKGLVKKTPETVAAERIAKGKVPFYLEKVNPDEIRFWVRRKAA